MLICISAAVALTAFLSDDNEPRYEGEKLSTWLAIYVKHAGEIEGGKAENAVRALGTNALPCLLKWVRHESSPSKSKQLLVVGLEWLPKSVAPSNFREWKFFMDSAFERASLAPIGFGLLGSTADVAIPELVAVANTSKDDQAIVHTMEALRRIGPTALPALITMITNTNLTPRFYAIAAVRVFGTNAAPAVPFLIERLHDKETSIAIAAAESLRELNLEPQTTFAAWTNMLNESRPLLRVVAVHAIARYDKQAQPVLPALLRMLEDEDRHVREAATNGLREITPEVFTNALPQ